MGAQGPEDTPYHTGCFIFDIYFPPQVRNQSNAEMKGSRVLGYIPPQEAARKEAAL